MLDGMCKLKDLVEAARKNSMTSMAITDHGNMYGVVEFYNTMKKAGIKPIIGMEAYVVDDVKAAIEGKIRAKNHLVLLVKNETGYKNLIKIASFAATEGLYYKPTVDKKFLESHAGGLIALSSCVQGEVPAAVINGEMEDAKSAAFWYNKTFGEGNFYLELQDHGLEDEKAMNTGLKEISAALSIPLTVTNDVHYLEKDDSKAHDILLCIQTGQKLNDENRMHFKTNEFYFKSHAEMKKLFPGDQAALDATVEIANKCDFELNLNPDKPYMPSYSVGDGKSYDEHLEKVAYAALQEKYGKINPDIEERFTHEIEIIKELKYSGYFLIVKDIVDFARSNDIPVGPGRGSAAGSIVSYALGITNVDPLKYGLLFERFLNPERVSPPDIDIDFSDEERDRVIQFIVDKFGRDRVAQIITFQTLKAKAAIKDVGRVLDIPYGDVDMLSKKVPETPGITFEEVLKDDNFTQYVNKDTTGNLEQIINYALKIEGLLRQDSTHAAGIVIAPDNLEDFVPLAKPKGQETEGPDNICMTQYPMESLERIGLLKFDILGLRNLSVIKRTLKTLKDNENKEVIFDTTFDNKEVYALLSEGDTQGVFQLESEGMRDLATKIRPSNFEEITAIISLFRPGPMRLRDDYVKRKKGLAKTEYDFDVLKEVLKETYGIAIYQEQVMQIAVKIADFSMSEADNLRRAMAKKKVEEMEKIKVKFIKNAMKKNISEDKAEELFEKLEQFSQYGFNKSHAAAYAVLAYQTAYLKAMHRGEYMAALLTSVMGKAEKVALYITDCKKKDINVLLPDVNSSDVEFKFDSNMIRYGLGAIKNVGISAAQEIIRERKENGKYKDLYEFCERVNMRIVNSKTTESLIKAGAFDSTLMQRSQMFAAKEAAMKNAETIQKDRDIGQTNLFGGESQKREWPDMAEWPEHELLTYEKEMLGLYVSSHPLAKYEKLLNSVSVPISRINKDINFEGPVIAGGVVHGLSRKITPGGERIYFKLEDLTDEVLVIVNEKIPGDKKEMLLENTIFMIRGRASRFSNDNTPFINMESLIKIEDAYDALGKYLHVRIREKGLEGITANEIHNVLNEHKGTASVIFHVITKDNREMQLAVDDKIKVRVSEKLLHQLENIVGNDNLWLSWKN